MSRLPHSTFHIPYSVKRSFTLIEILLASAMFTAIVVLMIGSFSDSLSFQSSSLNQRISRQSANSFTEYLSRALRAANTSSIHIDATEVNGAADYDGTGYVVVGCPAVSCVPSGYSTANGKIVITQNQNDYVGTGLIFPLPANDAGGNKWMYVGPDPTAAVNPVFGLYTTNQPSLLRKGSMTWKYAGQVLPAEVQIVGMSFRGINPRGLNFNADGSIKSYNTEAHPYVSITLQIASTDDPTNVTTYQTSLTSRDYKFAFPTCSVSGGC